MDKVDQYITSWNIKYNSLMQVNIMFSSKNNSVYTLATTRQFNLFFLIKIFNVMKEIFT